MVYCPKCGKEVIAEWTHCPYCGADLTRVFQQLPPERKRDRRKVIAALIGLSGFLGAGYLAYRYFGDEIMAIIEGLMREGGRATTAETTTTTFATGTTEISTSPSLTTYPMTSETATAASSTTASSLTSPATTTSAMTTQTTTTTAPIPEFPKRDWDRLACPYIWVGGQAYYNEVETDVENRGNAPSFYTVLEFYQGPKPNRYPELRFIEHPLNSFKLTWRRVVTLYPGQRLNFDLSNVTPRDEVLVWVCYDPLLDPRAFRMDSSAPLRSIFRNNLDRDRHVIVMGRGGTVEEW